MVRRIHASKPGVTSRTAIWLILLLVDDGAPSRVLFIDDASARVLSVDDASARVLLVDDA